tara:strand:- start:3510 stop:4598 length:1089 start_codon:yes stop_codon:yes gene_type:complete
MLRKSITLSLQEEVDLIKKNKGFATSISNPSFNARNLENIKLNNFNLQGSLSGEVEIKKIAQDKLFTHWKGSDKDYEVLITNGAKAALYSVFKAVAKKRKNNFGIINPNWPTYQDLVYLSGAKPFYFNTFLKDNYEIDLGKLDTFIKKNKLNLLVLSSPNNPCGKLYDHRTIKELISICNKRDCFLVIDESFSSIIFNQSIFKQKLNLNKNNIAIINSFSKNFHLQGLRLGAILASKQLIEEFANINIAVNGAPNNLSQFVVKQYKTKLLKTFDLGAKKKIITDFLTSKNVEFYEPDGSFYLFPKMKNKKNFMNLSKKNGIFYLGGEHFGSSQYNNFYRFCFEKKEADLKNILRIMNEYEIY